MKALATAAGPGRFPKLIRKWSLNWQDSCQRPMKRASAAPRWTRRKTEPLRLSLLVFVSRVFWTAIGGGFIDVLWRPFLFPLPNARHLLAPRGRADELPRSRSPFRC